MALNELSPEFAAKLLATFNSPVSAVSQEYDLEKCKGGFISNHDFFNQPHCCCAYFGSGDDQEFYLEWHDFDGVDDCYIIARNEGYAFQEIENATNFIDCIRITKTHLSKIINDEL